MARVGGVNIPDNKRFVISLTYIYGIGRTRAKKICEKLGIDESLRTKDLDESTLKKVRDLVSEQTNKPESTSESGLIEGDLRRRVRAFIKRLIDIKCYRGIRHIKKLPVRGQRTHTNARTRKGKAVPIPGKKK